MGLKLIPPLEDFQQNSKPETNQQVIPYKFGKEGGYSFEVTPKSEDELKLNLTGATAELLAALKEGGKEKQKVTPTSTAPLKAPWPPSRLKRATTSPRLRLILVPATWVTTPS